MEEGAGEIEGDVGGGGGAKTGNKAKLNDLNIKAKTIEEICKSGFVLDKTKMSSEAVKLTAEMIKIYVIEALNRSAEQAMKSGDSEVKMEHLEKVLPQFLLDFS